MKVKSINNIINVSVICAQPPYNEKITVKLKGDYLFSPQFDFYQRARLELINGKRVESMSIERPNSSFKSCKQRFDYVIDGSCEFNIWLEHVTQSNF